MAQGKSPRYSTADNDKMEIPLKKRNEGGYCNSGGNRPLGVALVGTANNPLRSYNQSQRRLSSSVDDLLAPTIYADGELS